MLSNEAQAASPCILVNPASYASTAAASSSWVFVGDFDGDLLCIQHLGSVQGSVTGSFDHAFSAAGASAASVNFNEGAFTAGATNNLQKRTVSLNSLGGYVRYRPTVTTGPAFIAVSIAARKRAGN